jgi:SAM-dependent methyltransferase
MQPELYHAHHNLHQKDLHFWLELAKHSHGQVLELGCGTGRVLLPMAQSGCQIAGIDNDLSMLRFTHTSFVQAKPVPWLVAADMRRFHFDIRFSLVILPCNTFSMLDRDGQQACLECVRQHLVPGGRFAFSIPNPDHLLGLPESSQPEIEDEFIHPSSGNPVQVSSAWQRTRRLFMVTWIYDHLLPDGRVERSKETIAHHLYPAEDYLDEVRSAGFEIKRLMGDFDGSDYQVDSPDLICTCSI